MGKRNWKLSSAEKQFVEDNIKLIPAILKCLNSFISIGNVIDDDIRAIANFALVLAVHSWFKRDRSGPEHSFKAHLRRVVKDELFHAKHRSVIINTPESLINKILKPRDTHYKERGRKMSDNELAKLLGISTYVVNFFDRALDPREYLSLNEYIDEVEEIRSATMEDNTFINSLDKIELKEQLKIKLAKTKNMREILVLNEQLARLEFETTNDD